MNKLSPRKQRIIDAAIEVLKENSIEDTTVRKIAAKAGLTTGALYHHYKNKDEILFDVISESFHFTHKVVDEKKSQQKDLDRDALLDKIVENVANRLSNVDQQLIHLLLVTDIIAGKSEIQKKYADNYQENILRTANLFEESFEIVDPTHKKVLASILIAALDGIAVQQALGVIDETDDLIPTFIDFFAKSIPAYLK